MKISKSSTKNEYVRRILRAQELISEDLDTAPTPSELAKASGFSKHHFHRIFRGLTGESVMEFSRRLRLERAARMLHTSERPVIDIALEAGYASHEAFTRSFAKVFGKAPTLFREGDSSLQKRLQETTALGCEIEVKTFPKRHMVFMQHIGPYLEVAPVWNAMIEWAFSTLLVEDPMQKMFGIVPDDPGLTDADKLRYKACLHVDRHFDKAELPEGPVAQTTLAAGRYAIATHRGPYETLHETYLDLIGRWFPQSEFVPAPAPVVERYLNNPGETAPEDLLTEVCVLIDEGGFSELR